MYLAFKHYLVYSSHLAFDYTKHSLKVREEIYLVLLGRHLFFLWEHPSHYSLSVHRWELFHPVLVHSTTLAYKEAIAKSLCTFKITTRGKLTQSLAPVLVWTEFPSS
jgi:hypothetical protein